MTILSLCLCCGLLITNVSADENVINCVVAMIGNSENVELHVKEVKKLYDILLRPNYNLIVFDEGGYAIATAHGLISEYSLETNDHPYQDYSDSGSTLYYFGPYNYVVKNNGYYINILDQTSIKSADLDKIVNLVQKYSDQLEKAKVLLQSILSKYNIDLSNISNLIATNKNLVSITNIFGASSAATNSDETKLVSLANSISWTNVNNYLYFRDRYNKAGWQNVGANASCCGPIAAAIMLAYYQDNYPSIVNLSSLRSKGSTSPGTLIQRIKSNTQAPTATTPSTLSAGVRIVLNTYEKTKSGVTAQLGYSTWSTAKSKINNSKPVCIGMTVVTGNPYGNHWVTAYGYGSSGGKNYYRCIDNHGNYSVAIQVSWTCGLVYLTK